MQPQYGISPQGDVLAFISTWEERIQGQPGRPWQLVLPILERFEARSVLRDNSVLADFIGFSSSGNPFCGHENSTHDGCRAISQFGFFHLASGCSMTQTQTRPVIPGNDSEVINSANLSYIAIPRCRRIIDTPGRLPLFPQHFSTSVILERGCLLYAAAGDCCLVRQSGASGAKWLKCIQ